MKKLRKIFLQFALVFILSVSLSAGVLADEETSSEETSSDEASSEETSSESLVWPEASEIYSGSALVIDTVTGATLFSQDADEKIYPASTTKLLTAILALENCSLDETVTFSETAVDLESGASSIDAVAGEEMSLEDVLYGLLLPSGNDCANAIAEHVAGSIDAFAEMMNEKAEELGCASSHFTNPSGLHDSDHYTTASDMFLIAKEAFSNSTIKEIISCASYTVDATNMSDERTFSNSNSLIQTDSSYYNSTVVGGKTGYTSSAGRALVILSESNNMNLICLFFNCPYYYGVFSDANTLLDYVYNNFSIVNISEAEERFSSSFADAKIVLDSTSSIIIPNSISLSDLDSTLTFATDMDAEEFEEAKLSAGVTTQDGRHLYAQIDYYFDGNYLGNIFVIVDDTLEISAASVSNVTYIDMIYAIPALILGLIILISAILIGLSRRKKFTRR